MTGYSGGGNLSSPGRCPKWSNGLDSASSEGSYFEVAGREDTEIRDFASHASLD